MKQAPVIQLGFEIGSGTPVAVPLHHLAVTGITQLAGKTTALEGLISRSGLRALAFVTKRAESGFQGGGNEIEPFFRESAGGAEYPLWRFVSDILGAILGEKLKFQRPWIMRACRGARTLADVAANVAARLPKAKGLEESVLTELAAYFEMVVPQLETIPRSSELKLKPGVNVMDLTALSTGSQMLVIAASLQWIYLHERDTITVIPEAWEFIPRARSSPVKSACEALIRKGGAAGNYVWIDTQDLAAVDADIRKLVGVYVLGVQREINEVKRTLDHVVGAAKPKAADVQQLGLGEFYVSHGRELHHVYAQPTWMSAADARAVAVGARKAAEFSRGDRREARPAPAVAPAGKEGDAMFDPTELTEAVKSLARDVRELTKALKRAPAAASNGDGQAAAPADVDAIVDQVLERIGDQLTQLAPAGDGAADVELTVGVPALHVTRRRHVVKLDDSTNKGRIARLIAEGMFDGDRNAGDVQKMLSRRGFEVPLSTIRDQLDEFAQMGFLTKRTGGNRSIYYKAVAGAEVNIIDEK